MIIFFDLDDLLFEFFILLDGLFYFFFINGVELIGIHGDDLLSEVGILFMKTVEFLLENLNFDFGC